MTEHAKQIAISIRPDEARRPRAETPCVAAHGVGDSQRRKRMNNLNSILLEGNMVRDPLIRATPKGTSVCSFTVASNRFFKQGSAFEKETIFIDIESWGKLADSCGAHGNKGRGVRVVGRLRQDRWQGSDGKNHSRVVIVAEHIEYRAQINNGSLPEEELQEMETQEPVAEFEPCTA